MGPKFAGWQRGVPRASGVNWERDVAIGRGLRQNDAVLPVHRFRNQRVAEK